METINQPTPPFAPPANHIAVISRRCALYRVYDTHNVLLYVGISTQPRRRFTQHRAEKTWWPQVARYTTEWFDNTGLAAAAEREAIRGEQPLHNHLRYTTISAPRVTLQPRPTRQQARAQRQPYVGIELHGHTAAVSVDLDTTGMPADPAGPLGHRWQDVDPDGILGLLLHTASRRALDNGAHEIVYGATGSCAAIDGCVPEDADPVADAFVDWWAGGTLALDLLDEWTA